jgi:hypothetical protein
MANQRYAALGLSDNPFPPVPTVDPTSRDIRMNGFIYDDEIFRSQLAALRQRIDRRENLIYAQNTKFVAGVGKSALIASEWRRLQHDAPETTVYVRCGRRSQADTIDSACNAIVDAWFRSGVFWKSLCAILLQYCREAAKPTLERGVVDNLIATNPRQPRSVPARALMLWDVRATVDAVTIWLEEVNPRIWSDVSSLFLATMLSEPPKFPDLYRKKVRKREVTGFITMLEIVKTADVGYPYIFLDQFEELFHGRGKKELHELVSSMRQILEACAGSATFVVTLHPSAAMTLRSADGQSLMTIAPLDDRRVVDLPNIGAEQSIHLVATYLSHFRLDSTSHVRSVAPFEESCIELVCRERDGNAREILQTMYYCIEVAVDQGASVIDVPFFHMHHREITGKISDQDLELS